MDQALVKSIHQLKQNNSDDYVPLPTETKIGNFVADTSSKGKKNSKKNSKEESKPIDINDVHDAYYALIKRYVEDHEELTTLFKAAAGARTVARLTSKTKSIRRKKTN